MQMRKFSPRRVSNNKRKGLFLKEAEKNLAICYFFKQSSGHISSANFQALMMKSKILVLKLKKQQLWQ